MEPMYEIAATVTTTTEKEGIKLTADWPLAWLQGNGSTTILRKIIPTEISPALSEPLQRLEIGGYNRNEFQIGDRVIVQLF
jgi:hypothetical protein